MLKKRQKDIKNFKRKTLIILFILITFQIGAIMNFHKEGKEIINPFLPIANAQSNNSPIKTGTISIISVISNDKEENEKPLLDYKTGEPIEGAKYSIYRIQGLNPNEEIDWAKYSNLKTEHISRNDNGEPFKVGAYNLKPETTITTNNEGYVKTKATPIGFFYIEQINTIKLEHNRIIHSKPFFVSIPIPINVVHKGYSFDNTVYPNNSKLEIRNSVIDEDKHAGDKIKYVIESDIPFIDNKYNKKYNNYTITIKQPTYTKWDKEEPKIELINKDNEASVTTLKNETDYKIKTPKDKPQLFNIEITRNGLDKIQMYKMGQKGKKHYSNLNVKISYNANINKMSEHTNLRDLSQINKSYLFFDNASIETSDGSMGTPNNPNDFININSAIESKYGKVSITRLNNNDKPIKNAEFQLYKCKPGKTGKAILAKDSRPIKVNGKNKWTTNKEGKIEIVGIKTEDWKNGKQIYSNLFDYCLLETKPFKKDGDNIEATRIELKSNLMVLEKTIKEDSNFLSTGYLYLSVAFILIVGTGFSCYLFHKKKKR